MKIATLALLVVLTASFAFGQCEGMPGMQHPKPAAPAPPAQKKDTPAAHDMAKMNAPEPGISEKLGSGTMPKPASSPDPMWMTTAGGWDIMAHGELFLTYNQQGGPRGVGKLESVNWLMLMERRGMGKGTLVFREMLSAEPLTFPHGGSPQLFQTGETYHGVPIVDHQHPHDVFGELSVTYTVPFNQHVAWQFYGGPVGEPALGPVTFVHRVSGAELPAAPLGHHLQDSTHITAGVVTAGFILEKRFKVEGSVFNGREPDENRATIDFAPMSSWSVRGSFLPNDNWALQYSFGHLVHPEALEPTDVDRQTASVAYNRPLAEGNWATTLVWGRNHKLAEDTRQNSYLLESTVNFRRKNYAFTRLELVDKDELFPSLPPPLPSFRIGAYTFGGVRDLVHNSKAQIGLGADVTFYSKPAALDPIYGDSPVSFQIFLRFRPGQKQH